MKVKLLKELNKWIHPSLTYGPNVFLPLLNDQPFPKMSSGKDILFPSFPLIEVKTKTITKNKRKSTIFPGVRVVVPKWVDRGVGASPAISFQEMKFVSVCLFVCFFFVFVFAFVSVPVSFQIPNFLFSC